MNRRMNGDIFPGRDTIPRLQSDFFNGLLTAAHFKSITYQMPRKLRCSINLATPVQIFRE